MQLFQDPSPAAWTRIVCASTHDTLITLYYNITQKCSASPGGNYSTKRYDAIIPLTRTFHPLPDRDRSRIASGLWVQRLPPVVVTLLLIVWVTLSGDTRNVGIVCKHDQTCYLHYRHLTLMRGVVVNPCVLQNLVEMTGIEPVVTEVGGFTVPCHTITAASPCVVLDSGVEPLLCG